MRRSDGITVQFEGDYPPLLPQEKSIFTPGVDFCLLGLKFLEKLDIGFFSDGNRSWLISRTVLDLFRIQIGEKLDEQETRSDDVITINEVASCKEVKQFA